MTTYYEIIKVQPTATIEEIETAVETQYNQWRRLVTHHDANVVNQANQALQTLEQIRSTLTDPAQRTGYDTAIGLSGPQVGGLADPEALLKTLSSPTLVPPAAKNHPLDVPLSQAQTIKRTDAWICPKCQTANAVNQQFCASCGNKIGHACPQCEQLTELVNPYCPHCGANKREIYTRKQETEIKSLQKKIANYNKNIQEWETAGNRVFKWGLNEDAKTKYIDLQNDLGWLQTLFGLGWIFSITISILLIGSTSSDDWLIPFALIFLLSMLLVTFGPQIFGKRFRSKKAQEKIAVIRVQISQMEQQIRNIQSHQYPE